MASAPTISLHTRTQRLQKERPAVGQRIEALEAQVKELKGALKRLREEVHELRHDED